MPPQPKPKPKPTGGADNINDVVNAIDDNYDDEFKKTLRMEARTLKRAIEREEVATGQYNDERLRINYFWLVAKKEKEDKEAELRNKNREYQDL